MGKLGLVVVALAACSNNHTAAVDAKLFDAPIDMTPVADHGGQISLQEISAWDGMAGHLFINHGLDVNISFSALAGTKDPTGFCAAGNATCAPGSTQHAGGLAPCYVVIYDVTDAGEVPVSGNEGNVTFTITKGAGGAGVAIPTCTYVTALGGYNCISSVGSSGSIVPAITDTGASGHSSVFTDASAAPATFTAADVGRYLVLTSGAGISGFGFPISGFASHSIGLNTPAAALGTAITPFPSATWMVAAGAGPLFYSQDVLGTNQVPILPTTTVYGINGADSVAVDFAGGADFSGFSTTVVSGGEWTPDTATQAILARGAVTDLTGTTDMVVGCDPLAMSPNGIAAGGCGSNLVAPPQGTILVVDTTDGNPATDCGDLAHNNGRACVAGELPAPAKYKGSLTCADFANTTTVPHQMLNLLAQTTPSMARFTVLRSAFQPKTSTTLQPNVTNVVVGSGYVNYQLEP